MFGFLNRKKPPVPAPVYGFPPLHFKDGAGAFEYACRYLTCSLDEGSTLPALVLDARELFGTPTATKTRKDGIQIVPLRVASDDGGFLVLASTAGPSGPILQPEQLVVWRAGRYAPEVVEAAKTKDERFGWVGLVLGTLELEHRNGGWIGDKMFSP